MACCSRLGSPAPSRACIGKTTGTHPGRDGLDMAQPDRNRAGCGKGDRAPLGADTLVGMSRWLVTHHEYSIVQPKKNTVNVNCRIWLALAGFTAAELWQGTQMASGQGPSRTWFQWGWNQPGFQGFCPARYDGAPRRGSSP